MVQVFVRTILLIFLPAVLHMTSHAQSKKMVYLILQQDSAQEEHWDVKPFGPDSCKKSLLINGEFPKDHDGAGAIVFNACKPMKFPIPLNANDLIWTRLEFAAQLRKDLYQLFNKYSFRIVFAGKNGIEMYEGEKGTAFGGRED